MQGNIDYFGGEQSNRNSTPLTGIIGLANQLQDLLLTLHGRLRFLYAHFQNVADVN
jgi:hypothetical protein